MLSLGGHVLCDMDDAAGGGRVGDQVQCLATYAYFFLGAGASEGFTMWTLLGANFGKEIDAASPDDLAWWTADGVDQRAVGAQFGAIR